MRRRNHRRRLLRDAAWILLAMVAPVVTPSLRAQEGSGAAGMFGLSPIELSAAGLYGQSVPGVEYPGEPPVRVDILFGAIVPLEGDGKPFGRATSTEDFDTGGLFGIRVQAWLHRFFRFGGEIDFASHDMERGDVLFPGDMSRVYFLAPVTFDVPFGPPERPFSFGVTVAPGFQVAIPSIDQSFEDFQAFSGRFLDQDPFVALNLRAAATLRIPITYEWRFFLEVQYDWAFGHTTTEVTNSAGAVLESRGDDIDLSSINAIVGFSFVF